MLAQARAKLDQQLQQNQARQKRIEEQRQNQRKQGTVLVQTFKNAIDTVVRERSEKLGNPYLTKDQLQPSEKKRVLELFVENDNTVQSLIEVLMK